MLSRSTVPWKVKAASSADLVTSTVGQPSQCEKRLPAVSAAIVSVVFDESTKKSCAPKKSITTPAAK